MRRPWVLLCALLLGGLLTACGSSGGPRAVNAPGLQVAPGPGVQVRQGDTLYTIAQRNNVALRDLIMINGLQPPYRIRPGDLLLLPVPRGYVVQRGDTVSEIAQRFDVETSRLIRENRLASPYTIFPGQLLTVPVPIGTSAPPSTVQARAAPRRTVVTAPPSPAARTANSVVIVPRPSPLKPAPPSRTVVAAKPEPVPVGQPEARQQTRQQARQQALEQAQQQAQPQARQQARPVRYAEPPAREGSRFLWPVQGRVVSNFGVKSDGSRNDGINIRAPEGLGVRAAESGVVAYVGDDLDAFGNLVLLRHRDGFMTAYAHLQASLVREGDVIRRGQIIGRIGATGSVTAPQLHFEVRRRAKPVDPMDHLEPVTG
ncbi:MAG: LysM peptidoglycan-binding domain-containing M23 family metallopeptidase [Alphaproteobacteria bacterium]|nr:LysM peptidoglycan-binding domain-containing M23 family metallopeptidase [Alphaproteobacteria bacterium]